MPQQHKGAIGYIGQQGVEELEERNTCIVWSSMENQQDDQKGGIQDPWWSFWPWDPYWREWQCTVHGNYSFSKIKIVWQQYQLRTLRQRRWPFGWKASDTNSLTYQMRHQPRESRSRRMAHTNGYDDGKQTARIRKRAFHHDFLIMSSSSRGAVYLVWSWKGREWDWEMANLVPHQVRWEMIRSSGLRRWMPLIMWVHASVMVGRRPETRYWSWRQCSFYFLIFLLWDTK